MSIMTGPLQQLANNRPGHRRRLACSSTLLALGAGIVGQAVSARPALVQCNPGDGAPPPPPAAGITSDVSNQTFGPPPNAFSFQADGQAGCNGPKNLNPNALAPFSGPGQQGGNVTLTGTNVRIVGGAPQGPAQPAQTIYGAYVTSTGGNAGTGGEGNYAGGDGGAGGPGPKGGAISVRLGVDVVPSTSLGAAGYGIGLNASGGAGGDGGANDLYGIYEDGGRRCCWRSGRFGAVGRER